MTNNNINIRGLITDLIDKSIFEQRNSQNRGYLGASRLGAPCSRGLQYEYNNTPKDEGLEHSGRLLRIFEAGHVFEGLIIKWLRSAGFTLITEDERGEQLGFRAAASRMAGHVDGIITGVPKELEESIKTPALLEIKSMKASSWRILHKKNLVLSHPIYATQIALYQAYMEGIFPGLSSTKALFIAINKDTAEIYTEMVPFDVELAQEASDKAVNIIKAEDAGELMPRPYSSKEVYTCKICAFKERCWGDL